MLRVLQNSIVIFFYQVSYIGSLQIFRIQTLAMEKVLVTNLRHTRWQSFHVQMIPMTKIELMCVLPHFFYCC